MGHFHLWSCGIHVRLPVTRASWISVWCFAPAADFVPSVGLVWQMHLTKDFSPLVQMGWISVSLRNMAIAERDEADPMGSKPVEISMQRRRWFVIHQVWTHFNRICRLIMAEQKQHRDPSDGGKIQFMKNGSLPGLCSRVPISHWLCPLIVSDSGKQRQNARRCNIFDDLWCEFTWIYSFLHVEIFGVSGHLSLPIRSGKTGTHVHGVKGLLSGLTVSSFKFPSLRFSATVETCWNHHPMAGAWTAGHGHLHATRRTKIQFFFYRENWRGPRKRRHLHEWFQSGKDSFWGNDVPLSSSQTQAVTTRRCDRPPSFGRLRLVECFQNSPSQFRQLVQKLDGKECFDSFLRASGRTHQKSIPKIWHRCCAANGSLSFLTFWQSQKVVFSRKSSGKMMVSNPSCPSPACILNLLHSQRYLEKRYLEMATDTSLTGGVSDAAQPDEKRHQGSAVSAVSALCVDHLWSSQWSVEMLQLASDTSCDMLCPIWLIVIVGTSHGKSSRAFFEAGASKMQAVDGWMVMGICHDILIWCCFLLFSRCIFLLRISIG